MILIKKEKFEIGTKSTSVWSLKPEWNTINCNYFRVQNGKDFKFINTWSYFIPTEIRLYFLIWIFYIKIKPKRISSETPSRYVRFEDTHLELLNIPHGKWSDEN